MNVYPRSFSVGGAFLLALAVAFLAVYFRTYVIHGGPQYQVRRLSESVSALRKPLSGTGAETVSPQTPGDQPRGRWRLKHLLELDPYHYLWQTEQVVKTGRSGPEIKAGKVLNPLGRAPYGIWEPFLIHPYLGAYFYTSLRLFFPDIKVLEAVAYFPLLLVILIPFAYGVFARVAGFDLISSVYGMTTMVLAPFIVFRTLYGWYDTDAYSMIFPLGVLSFLLFALKKERYFLLCASGAALLTGVYAVCWPGWFYLPVLITASMVVALAALACASRFRNFSLTGPVLKLLGGYWAGLLLFLALMMGPEGLWESCRLAWTVFQQFIFAQRDLWPDVFTTVGEAQPVNFPEMIMTGGTFTTLGLALFGIGLELHRAFKEEDARSLFRAIFFSIFCIPLIVLSLHARRFTELVAMPLAILAGFGILNLGRLMEAEKTQKGSSRKGLKFGPGRRIVWILILCFAFGKQLVSAHETAGWDPVFVTDVMDRACQKLKETSPPDSIVNAWWDSGYVLNQAADRRVLVDGGSQDSRVLYWLSAALITDDERLSAGILRMINTSRNDAFEFLERLGMKPADGVALIRQVVPLSRAQAFRGLPASMTEAQKNGLLDKTHGVGALAPVYVFIDQTLMQSSSLAVSFARWDFNKAESLLRRPKGIWEEIPADRKFDDASGDYFDHSKKVAPCFLHLPLVKTDGDLLVFRDGMAAAVNWREKDAMLTDLLGTPIGGFRSMFFYDDAGQQTEKRISESAPDVSVLIAGEGDRRYAIVSETPLIRSVLFRLYYFDAAGLTLFKPVIREGSVESGLCIKVFELDRSKFQA